MTILGFLTGNSPQRVVISRDDPEAPGLTLDAALQLRPFRNVDITKNPVESGANIADHATLGNFSFDLEGIISEAPLPEGFLGSGLGLLAGAAGGLIGTQVGGVASTLITTGAAVGVQKAVNFALSPDIPDGASLEQQIANRDLNDDDYPRKAWDYLLGLQQGRDLLRVVTKQKTYTNLLIRALSNPQTIDEGRSVKFTATFEQVQLVTSASVDLPENVIAADATGGASKANNGQQAAGEATEKQTENVSILKSFTNSVGG